MRKTSYLLTTLAVLGFTFMGCEESSEDAETKATFRIGLAQSLGKAGSPSNTFTVTDEGGTVFTISEARANVRHIQFDLPDESEQDSSEKVSFDGPFIFDLVAGSQSPSIGAFDLEEGLYKRLDIRFDDAEAEDGLLPGSDPLLDNTLLVSGTFDYDGEAARNFRFVLKFNEDLRFEDAGGVLVEAHTTTDVLLELDVSQWLSGIDITACLDGGDLELDDNGDLFIDDDSDSGCQDLESTIKENIKNNYDLH